MTFRKIQQGFFDYLQSKNVANANKYLNSQGEVKFEIFKNTAQFHYYMTNVLNVNYGNINLEFDQLKNLDFQDGNFVADESLSKLDKKVVELINQVSKQKEIIELYDTTQDGVLDKDEILKFLDATNVIDEPYVTFDKANISIKEVFDALGQIALTGKLLSQDEENTFVGVAQPFYSSIVQPAKNYFSYFKEPFTSGDNNRPYIYRSYVETPEVVGIKSKTDEELNDDLETNKNTLNTQQAQLSDILTGADATLSDLNEAFLSALDDYKKLDAVNLIRLTGLEMQYVTLQQQYDSKCLEYINAETDEYSKKQNLDVATEVLASYEERLGQLTSIDKTNMDSSKKAELERQIQELQGIVEEKRLQKTEAEQAYSEAKRLKDELNVSKNNTEILLNNVKQDFENFENGITFESEQVKVAFEKMQQARNAYEVAKADAVAKKQSEIQVTNQKIAEIEAELATRKTNSELQQYSVAIPLTAEMLDNLQTQHGINVSMDENGNMYAHYTWARYNRVRPELNEKLSQLEQYALSKGFVIVRSDGERTYAQSAAGRRKKGNLVATPGNSPHNYGAAADLTIYDAKTGRMHDFKNSTNPAVRDIVRYAQEECGLVWGGSWNKKGEQHHWELADWRGKYRGRSNEYVDNLASAGHKRVNLA